MRFFNQKLVRVDYPLFDEACDNLVNQIHNSSQNENRRVRKVIGIARGGLPIAVELSHQLNAPLIPVCYSAKSGHGDNKNHLNNLPELEHPEFDPRHGTPIVVITDDIADSGHTLNEVAAYYFGKGYEVQTAVLFWKPSSHHTPTYYWRQVENDSDWIVFPWEIPPATLL